MNRRARAQVGFFRCCVCSCLGRSQSRPCLGRRADVQRRCGERHQRVSCSVQETEVEQAVDPRPFERPPATLDLPLRSCCLRSCFLAALHRSSGELLASLVCDRQSDAATTSTAIRATLTKPLQ